jgi:hypothetical protein
MARPDWVAGASLEDLERMLDALNGMPQTPVLYITGLPDLAARLYGGPRAYEQNWLFELFARREHLVWVTEETEDRPGRGRGWKWWPPEQLVEVSDLPTEPADLGQQVVLAHCDPRDPTAAGPYVSEEVAGLLADQAREYLPRSRCPGVLVDFLSGVRQRSAGREVTRGDILDEMLQRTGLPPWLVSRDYADFKTGLAAAQSSVLAKTGSSESAGRVVGRIAKNAEYHRRGFSLFRHGHPYALLLTGGPVELFVGAIAEQFYGVGSLLELDLALLPRAEFQYFHEWAGPQLRSTVGRVFLLRNPEHAPEHYLSALGGYLKNLWDWSNRDATNGENRHMIRNWGHDFALGSSVVALAVTSEKLAAWVRKDWKGRVFHNEVTLGGVGGTVA